MPRLAIIVLVGFLFAAGSQALAAPKPESDDPAAAPAGVYMLDKSHASLTAQISHMGLSRYTMRFDRFDARYDYDPGKPDASQISVTIDATSLDVGDADVGRQFAREFLGADKFPQITFVSSGVLRTENGHGTVTGDLTLNGVTRPVTLDVIFNGSGHGPFGFGAYRMGFSATADIKRSDFDSKAWESMVGDDVHLAMEVEFARK